MPYTICTRAYQEQVKYHVIPYISLYHSTVCIHSYKLPSTSPPWAPSNPYLSYVSLLCFPLVKAATLRETSGSRYSLMTSFSFHSYYHPHYPKSSSSDSLSHLASGPQFAGCASCHSHYAPLKYASMCIHTHAKAQATSTLKSEPKPAAGSAVRTCPHTSTFLETILACLACLSLREGDKAVRHLFSNWKGIVFRTLYVNNSKKIIKCTAVPHISVISTFTQYHCVKQFPPHNWYTTAYGLQETCLYSNKMR